MSSFTSTLKRLSTQIAEGRRRRPFPTYLAKSVLLHKAWNRLNHSILADAERVTRCRGNHVCTATLKGCQDESGNDVNRSVFSRRKTFNVSEDLTADAVGVEVAKARLDTGNITRGRDDLPRVKCQRVRRQIDKLCHDSIVLNLRPLYDYWGRQ